jgi:hypothetical protein
VTPRVAHAFGPRTRQAATPDHPQTSTHHNTTNMAAIDKAIEDLESRDRVDNHMYGEVAVKYGCSRSAVSRRWRGVSRTKTASDQGKQVIPPQQELELVQYITDLHVNGLAPTREMIQNFGSEVAGRAVSMSWVDRFLHRNHDHLTVRWAPPIDRVRQQADSIDKYDSYFDILHQKIKDYGIKKRLTFNMDEKGFMIGVQSKSKRVFSKVVWVKDGAKAPIQDGNREWITIIPTICADGTTLFTSIIYPSDGFDLYDSWVEDIPPEDTSINLSSTPTGWTNNKLGLAWLKRFHQATKTKARRSWRLLICDGHGSHMTMEFLAYAVQKRILIMVFPSHSTHTLQPLDVGLFGPLSRYYSSELSWFQQQSQGLLQVKKADFYGFFKAAYASSFTQKNIESAFEATGIWPMDRSVVTTKFKYTTPPEQIDKMGLSHLSPANWERVDRLLKEAVKEGAAEVIRKLSGPIHRAMVQTKLLKLDNEGLLTSLDIQNKRTRNGRRLPFKGKKKQPTDATLFSPRKVQEAREIRRQKDDDKLAEAKRVKDNQGLNKQKREVKEQRAAEARAERDRNKRVKEQEKAEEDARQQAEKERKDREKALQTSQTGKRKASRPLAKQKKRQKRVGGRGALSVAIEAAPAQPVRTSRGGRNIKTPAKFR